MGGALGAIGEGRWQVRVDEGEVRGCGDWDVKGTGMEVDGQVGMEENKEDMDEEVIESWIKGFCFIRYEIWI